MNVVHAVHFNELVSVRHSHVNTVFTGPETPGVSEGVSESMSEGVEGVDVSVRAYVRTRVCA